MIRHRRKNIGQKVEKYFEKLKQSQRGCGVWTLKKVERVSWKWQGDYFTSLRVLNVACNIYPQLVYLAVFGVPLSRANEELSPRQFNITPRPSPPPPPESHHSPPSLSFSRSKKSNDSRLRKKKTSRPLLKWEIRLRP